jgi:hypothetical protein
VAVPVCGIHAVARPDLDETNAALVEAAGEKTASAEISTDRILVVEAV